MSLTLITTVINNVHYLVFLVTHSSVMELGLTRFTFSRKQKLSFRNLLSSQINEELKSATAGYYRLSGCF